VAKKSQRSSTSTQGLSLIRAQNGQCWVFSHPAFVRDCTDDLDEVRDMIAAGETELATDELRWLLGLCGEMLAAHFLLGKLAVEAQQDLSLGRGHFGAGYQLGLQAWRRAGQPVPLSAEHPANRIFFDCGRGLAWCLHHLDKNLLAVEVLEQLRVMDPTDPLGLAGWLDELHSAGKPLVELGTLFPPK
jgi:hypothetical protein